MNLRLSKNIVQNISLALCFFLFFSATPTMWPQQFALNTNATAIATQFQLLNGSNRIVEARELLSIIVNQKLFTINDFKEEQVTTNYTLCELKKVFGKPTFQNPDGSLMYVYDFTAYKSFIIKYYPQQKKTEITINK